jgi:hypothetical protein
MQQGRAPLDTSSCTIEMTTHRACAPKPTACGHVVSSLSCAQSRLISQTQIFELNQFWSTIKNLPLEHQHQLLRKTLHTVS